MSEPNLDPKQLTIQEAIDKKEADSTKKNIEVLTIAKEVLGLETLEERKSDGLDFTSQSVWNIKKALEQAYKKGKESQ